MIVNGHRITELKSIVSRVMMLSPECTEHNCKQHAYDIAMKVADLVAAAEREACAKDVEAAYTLGLFYGDVAAAIRARGQA